MPPARPRLPISISIWPWARRIARRLLKPMVLAKLIHAADIASSDRVLDVGCATGYAAAVLARLAGQVVALDQDAGLVQAARSALADAAQCERCERPADRRLAAGCALRRRSCSRARPRSCRRPFWASSRTGAGWSAFWAVRPAAKAMLYCRSGNELGGRPIFDANGSGTAGLCQGAGFRLLIAALFRALRKYPSSAAICGGAAGRGF